MTLTIILKMASGDKSDDLEKVLILECLSGSDDGLDGDFDVFNGVNVRSHHLKGLRSDTFLKKLSISLSLWKKEGRRGIWIKIPIDQSDLIPVATKLGFDFHHAKEGYAMLTKWIQDTPSTIPSYAHHTIGVAGFVVNDKNQLLVIQERYLVALNKPIWKLPGGLGDPGENLGETAVREVREETGIETEFITLLSFRHMHKFRFDKMAIDHEEIAACKWIDLDEYIADPETTPTNRMIAESYVNCCKQGVSITPTTYSHFIANKPDLVMYSLDSFKPPFSSNNEMCHKL